MLEKKRFMSRVVSMAIAVIVGTTMLFGTGDEVSAASKKPYRVVITSVKSIDHDSVKITWKKAKYAKKYKVYRATSKNGKYRLVKTTKYRSFTNNKLTTGKRYYYKVKAVNGSKSGRYSYKKSVVPTLNKVSLNKITVKGEDYAKLTFNKVKGASGYQIYRSKTGETGTFNKVNSTKYLSYKNTGLEADKGYYYKVRAYKKVSGKYKYGAFSSVRHVRTDDHNWVVEFDTNGDIVGDICSNCEKQRFHIHRIVLDARYTVPATCTEDGYYEDTCECGEVTRTSIKALGHKYNAGTTIVKPTCTEDGYRKEWCKCGEVKVTVIEPLGHEFNSRTVVEPTCTEEGYMDKFCKCGEVERTVLEPLGHTLDDNTATVVKEPTCTEEGLKEGVCSVCGKECTEVIEKSGCVWEPVTETIYSGYYKKAPQIVGKCCTVCDDWKTIPLEELDSHLALHPGEDNVIFQTVIEDVNTDEWVVTSKNILKGYKCKNCGNSNDCEHLWEHQNTEYYQSCNLCAKDITGCEDEHSLYHRENDGIGLSWTGNYRYGYKCTKCGVERIKDTCKTVIGESHYIAK